VSSPPGNGHETRPLTRTDAWLRLLQPSFSQDFRKYVAWLDHVLDIRPTANERLDASEYDFRVFDTHDALHEAIEARNGENKARVVAGYTPEVGQATTGDRLLLAVLSPSQQAWIGQRQSLAGVGSYTYVGYASGNIEPKVHDEVG